MARNATPSEQGAQPGPEAMPAAAEEIGQAERGHDRPGVQRERRPVDRPLDQQRQADREHDEGARGRVPRQRLTQEEQAAEHEQEDPDPRQAPPATRPGPPHSTTPTRTRRRARRR